MNRACHLVPTNKKEYIADLGKILVQDYGKQKYYKPEEVKKAHKKSRWSNLDFSCWGMSIFTSHWDFDYYHQQTGEACDYVAMKAEMLQAISVGEGASIIELTDKDIDASWIDFEEVFGGISEGIGEFIAGIFEGW